MANERKPNLVIEPGSPRHGVYAANRILKTLIPQLIAIQDRQENRLVPDAAKQLDHIMGQLRMARTYLQRAKKMLRKPVPVAVSKTGKKRND